MSGEERDRPPRQLGVIEAFVTVRDQCPSGRARAVAEGALEAAKERRPGALRQHAWFVLSAISGWRGERAGQVHASLKAFLDQTADGDPGD